MRILKIETLPSVKEGWADKDRIMLHGCFQLLVDFVEKEGGLAAWSHSDYKEDVKELQYLYDWWKSYADFDDTEKEQEHLERLIKKRGYLWA